MEDCKRLVLLCQEALKTKGIDDTIHNNRLRWELKELQVKNDCGYFLNIHDKGVKNQPNHKNVLVPYLLDICNEFDITKLPEFLMGEMPDIDVDYLPEIQQYLKNDYVPKAFGAEYVCNIGSHNTLGVKSALIDTVRIYSKDRDEILKITTKLQDKNDEGKPISFEEAINSNSDLKKYLAENPEIKEAAGKLVGKTRSFGQHAAGVIISSVPLKTLVPLISGKDGMQCSAWGEGQHSLDLSTVGLIKFDFLGSESLNKVMQCLKLIKERHGIEKVCAAPGGDNWSDISYLNDPKCLEMASKGDLKTIFQFDSDVARKMCKDGGVDRFEDLVAYTSLNRPGCLEMGTDVEFIKRKKGASYEVHPLLEPILRDTYALMLYQEQLFRILNVVGKIPEHQCMEVQKAVSKKKVDKFAKYKEMFVENGQKVLNQSKEELEKLWALIEAFAKYSFNLAHACSYTYVSSRMLWLKCHYPLEWYAACMSSLKTADSKLQEYRYDGVKHDIVFNRLDINKSKSNFAIAEDNSIYYAFSKIKGIGDDIADRITSLQPYADLKDFLHKFGVLSNTLKPLIALRIFGDDTVSLWKEYERFKDGIDQKIEDLNTKHAETINKHASELMSLLPEQLMDINSISEIDKLENIIDAKIYKKLLKIKEKNGKTIETFNKKLAKLENYEVKIEPEYEKLLLDKDAAEIAFYGFPWDSPLSKYVSAEEHHFDWMDANGLEVAPINVRITNIQEKQGKVKFYQLTVQDILGAEKKANIWNSDYNIWKELLVVGALIRIQLKAPNGGFPTYTMTSERFKKYVRGVNDFRIVNLAGEVK
jgi:DNA polymerase III alpha subunit